MRAAALVGTSSCCTPVSSGCSRSSVTTSVDPIFPDGVQRVEDFFEEVDLYLRGLPLLDLRTAVLVRALPLLGGHGNGLGTHGTSTTLTSSSILAAPRASGMFWSAISTATTS